MSDSFRPLFGTGQETSEDSFKDETQKLLEEKKRVEEELKKVRAELSQEASKKKSLQEELDRIKAELDSKIEEMEKLRSELTGTQNNLQVLQKTLDALRESMGKLREELRSELVSLSMEVVREFLMRDVVPKEELVTQILEEVFDSSLELKGNLKIFLNPADMDGVFDFIAGIKEKLGDKVDIEVVGNKELQRGEITIETPKFVVERRHDEILSEVMSEVLKKFYEGS